MWLKTAICRNFSPIQTANVAYLQRKIQLSGISEYPDGSVSQLIRIVGSSTVLEISLQHFPSCNLSKSCSNSFIAKCYTTVTYLLTPWSRVLLEKLTGSAASQEILRILWNLTVNYRNHTRPPLRFILMSSSHLRLSHPSDPFSQVSPPKRRIQLSCLIVPRKFRNSRDKMQHSNTKSPVV
jgi:hypothetical protein